MIKIYAEIGYGNDTLFSTEFVREDGREYRLSRFVEPERVTEYYLRFWVFKTVFIVSTKDGFKRKKKKENRFKVLFGVGGEKGV